ncbi:RHS repeat domain-containing protein [Streptomyces sp. WAC06614]|uniref:RHS repeat domain-containing protein n=1 Tax=Streptomyces sp. WAC06614 TaxID=2487416 RepID=UPI000F7823F8|nr:RHS repeat domain-containing protein [Streptomyces sp. WAC06614]RSS79418.1 hypothetical protein EF918_17525 [Streptomyces sp. WAC06614]
MTSTTDVYGKTTRAEYTPASGAIVTKVTTTNTLGHTSTNEMDPGRGLPVAQEDANKRRTVMRYDALGRLTQAWSPDRDPATMTPDAGDTPTKAILDAQGRKTELLQFAGEDPTGPVAHSTKYAYTPKGQLDSVTDQSGSVWSYKYDMRGRPIEVNDPDKGTTRTTYDIGDRIQTVTDARGKTVAFAC